MVAERGWAGKQTEVTEHVQGVAHAQFSRQLPIAGSPGGESGGSGGGGTASSSHSRGGGVR